MCMHLGNLAALLWWAFVGRDVPISLQFSAQAARYAINANVSHVLSSSFSSPPLTLATSYHIIDTSDPAIFFRSITSRISVSQLPSFCLSSIRNCCQQAIFQQFWFSERSVNREGTGRDCALPGRRGSVRWIPLCLRAPPSLFPHLIVVEPCRLSRGAFRHLIGRSSNFPTCKKTPKSFQSAHPPLSLSHSLRLSSGAPDPNHVHHFPSVSILVSGCCR